MSGITGKKPSELNDPVVAVDNTAWLVLETSDGHVVRVHPSDIASAATVVQDIYQLNFSGSVFPIPGAINGGKLPTDDAKILVFTNGVLDYLTADYTTTRNAGATPDAINFINPRNNVNIHIKLIR